MLYFTCFLGGVVVGAVGTAFFIGRKVNRVENEFSEMKQRIKEAL